MGGVRKHLGCASMEAQEGGVAVSGRVQGLQAWQRRRGAWGGRGGVDGSGSQALPPVLGCAWHLQRSSWAAASSCAQGTICMHRDAKDIQMIALCFACA